MVLRLDGVIDTLTAPQLDKVVSQLIQQEKYRLVLDLAGVDYISSAGWGIFISHLKELREGRGDLKVARMLPEVNEIFELLEFDTVIQSYDNLEKAIGDFSAPVPARPEVTREDHQPVTAVDISPALLVPEAAAGVAVLSPAPQPEQAVKSLEEKTLSLVQEDPLYKITEIKELLESPRFGENRVSWWKVFLILRKYRLLRLRRRCLFSRQAGKSF